MIYYCKGETNSFLSYSQLSIVVFQMIYSLILYLTLSISKISISHFIESRSESFVNKQLGTFVSIQDHRRVIDKIVASDHQILSSCFALSPLSCHAPMHNSITDTAWKKKWTRLHENRTIRLSQFNTGRLWWNYDLTWVIGASFHSNRFIFSIHDGTTRRSRSRFSNEEVVFSEKSRKIVKWYACRETFGASYCKFIKLLSGVIRCMH